jgi:hypothetical protein
MAKKCDSYRWKQILQCRSTALEKPYGVGYMQIELSEHSDSVSAPTMSASFPKPQLNRIQDNKIMRYVLEHTVIVDVAVRCEAKASYFD